MSMLRVVSSTLGDPVEASTDDLVGAKEIKQSFQVIKEPVIFEKLLLSRQILRRYLEDFVLLTARSDSTQTSLQPALQLNLTNIATHFTSHFSPEDVNRGP